MKKKHLEILLEDMRDDIKLVLEGQQVLRNEMGRMEERLSAKIDLNTDKIDILIEKIDHNTARIDAVGVDLKTHRADTEIHHGVYRVQELQKD
ncbi:MAG: hypothetical protein U9P07_00955 [Pseudomonadota bacterium]|nr:hypothetical protein [Pseudomonadota bacterium]